LYLHSIINTLHSVQLTSVQYGAANNSKRLPPLSLAQLHALRSFMILLRKLRLLPPAERQAAAHHAPFRLPAAAAAAIAAAAIAAAAAAAAGLVL